MPDNLAQIDLEQIGKAINLLTHLQYSLVDKISVMSGSKAHNCIVADTVQDIHNSCNPLTYMCNTNSVCSRLPTKIRSLYSRRKLQ